MPRTISESAVYNLLYQKAAALIEAKKMQAAAGLFELNTPLGNEPEGVLEGCLQEADPKPRVEKDHEGKPVIPTREMYAQYFEAMAAEHIKDQLESVKERWAQAKNPAEKAAISNEESAAKEALGKKSVTEAQRKPKKLKFKGGSNLEQHILNAVHAASGGSQLANLVASHITKRLFGNKPKP